eukprot:g12653.t1
MVRPGRLEKWIPVLPFSFEERLNFFAEKVLSVFDGAGKGLCRPSGWSVADLMDSTVADLDLLRRKSGILMAKVNESGMSQAELNKNFCDLMQEERAKSRMKLPPHQTRLDFLGIFICQVFLAQAEHLIFDLCKGTIHLISVGQRGHKQTRLEQQFRKEEASLMVTPQVAWQRRHWLFRVLEFWLRLLRDLHIGVGYLKPCGRQVGRSSSGCGSSSSHAMGVLLPGLTGIGLSLGHRRAMRSLVHLARCVIFKTLFHFSLDVLGTPPRSQRVSVSVEGGCFLKHLESRWHGHCLQPPSVKASAGGMRPWIWTLGTDAARQPA